MVLGDLPALQNGIVMEVWAAAVILPMKCECKYERNEALL